MKSFESSGTIEEDGRFDAQSDQKKFDKVAHLRKKPIMQKDVDGMVKASLRMGRISV